MDPQQLQSRLARCARRKYALKEANKAIKFYQDANHSNWLTAQRWWKQYDEAYGKLTAANARIYVLEGMLKGCSKNTTNQGFSSLRNTLSSMRSGLGKMFSRLKEWAK